MNYPKHAARLIKMLDADQQTWRGFWQKHYKHQQSEAFKTAYAKVHEQQRQNAAQILQILDEIGDPSLTNIGADAAQAMSIIALHHTLPTLKRILAAFERCYSRDKDDTYFQAIPSMTDRVLILERQPQRFGTQWEGNGLSAPYLPTVEDFEHIDARREAYGIEPLRWPKSLAIPIEEQPWLKLPLSSAQMRDISDEEFEANYQSSLN